MEFALQYSACGPHAPDAEATRILDNVLSAGDFASEDDAYDACYAALEEAGYGLPRGGVNIDFCLVDVNEDWAGANE